MRRYARPLEIFENSKNEQDLFVLCIWNKVWGWNFKKIYMLGCPNICITYYGQLNNYLNQLPHNPEIAYPVGSS